MGRLSEGEVEQSHGGADNVVIRHEHLTASCADKIGKTVFTTTLLAANHRNNEALPAHCKGVSGQRHDATQGRCSAAKDDELAPMKVAM